MARKTVHAELREGVVYIQDEKKASQIYNKGYFGTPQSGNGLMLSLMEAVYLQDIGRIQVWKKKRPLKMMYLIRQALSTSPSFDIQYIVYRDMRQRGYIVMSAPPPFHFRVFPRGGSPKKTPTKMWILAISERSMFKTHELAGLLLTAQKARKQFVMGVVDEEGDLTYYAITNGNPKGRVEPLPEVSCTAVFLTDRAVVFDESAAEALHTTHFYGKPVGNGLHLSLTETAYLMETGILHLKNGKSGRSLSLPSLLRRAKRVQEDFEIRLAVYRDLRNRGLVVKTGFKYGTHFRAYEWEPECIHARFLVHAVPDNFKSMWPEISRAVRLAHGVKKELLIGLVRDSAIEYLKLKRVRP